MKRLKIGMFYKKLIKQKKNTFIRLKGYTLKLLKYRKNDNSYSDYRFVGYEAFTANYLDEYKKI